MVLAWSLIMKNRKLLQTFIVAAILTIAADLLVYAAVPGAAYGILLAAIVGGLLFTWERKKTDLTTIIFIALLGGIAVQFTLQPSVSGFFVGILLLLGLSFHALVPLRDNPVGFLWRAVLSSLASVWFGVGEIAGCAAKKAEKSRIRMPKWWIIALPVFLVFIFAVMLANANPVFNKFVATAWHSIWDFITDIFRRLNMLRFLFWVLFFISVYGIFRMRYLVLGSKGPEQAQLYAAKADPRSEYLSCLISMASLNVLFVIVNVVDIVYLWFTSALPEGVTYAKYAHTGSYRLIVTVIVSAIVVCGFYRRKTIQLESRLARVLVYSWIIQNMFLILSALRRLLIYIDAYGLTRWRVSVVLWIALVYCGFVLVIIKVARTWGAWRLVKANIMATLVLFYIAGFLNIDGLIADYNVERYLQNKTNQMDIVYLADLDYNALPAIAKLEYARDMKVRQEADRILRAEVKKEMKHYRDWRTYHWRRDRVMKKLYEAQPGLFLEAH